MLLGRFRQLVARVRLYPRDLFAEREVVDLADEGTNTVRHHGGVAVDRDVVEESPDVAASDALRLPVTPDREEIVSQDTLVLLPGLLLLLLGVPLQVELGHILERLGATISLLLSGGVTPVGDAVQRILRLRARFGEGQVGEPPEGVPPQAGFETIHDEEGL